VEGSVYFVDETGNLLVPNEHSQATLTDPP
jgi:hypothetical protein